MQNKGFVKVFAILLTLVCVFYLSFSFVTRYHMKKAAEDPKGETHYLDSVQNEKVWLGSYTLKQCREMEIGLGLDLAIKKRLLAPISFSIIITAYGKERSLLLTYMENSITAMYPGICLQLWEGRPVCEDTTKADTETKI